MWIYYQWPPSVEKFSWTKFKDLITQNMKVSWLFLDFKKFEDLFVPFQQVQRIICSILESSTIYFVKNEFYGLNQPKYDSSLDFLNFYRTYTPKIFSFENTPFSKKNFNVQIFTLTSISLIIFNISVLGYSTFI